MIQRVCSIERQQSADVSKLIKAAMDDASNNDNDYSSFE